MVDMWGDKRGKFFVGKISDFTKQKGWFFGHFMDEELLCSDLVEIAWQNISNKKPSASDKHFHKVSVEINIVISGWVKLVIDGQLVKVKKGGFYVIYPQTLVEKVEGGEDTELIVVRAPSIAGDKFWSE